MSQYRNGKFTSAAAAVTLPLGFVPDVFRTYNYTALATDATAVIESMYFNNVTPSGYASQISKTITTGALTEATITTNGFTPVILGGDWYNTIYTITTISNASPGVVTIAGLTPTNGQALVNGMTVTISGVNGMTGVNTQRFIVSNLTIVGGGPTYTFTLYDLFGNPFSTIGLGTYTSGGQLDMISYPPTAPVLNSTNGQVITPGQPAGNQYDIGYEGLILGTGVVGASTNVIFWEAFYSTPTGW
jgi:hypothetical protein